jgi:hypothetical protein
MVVEKDGVTYYDNVTNTAPLAPPPDPYGTGKSTPAISSDQLSKAIAGIKASDDPKKAQQEWLDKQLEKPGVAQAGIYVPGAGMPEGQTTTLQGQAEQAAKEAAQAAASADQGRLRRIQRMITKFGKAPDVAPMAGPTLGTVAQQQMAAGPSGEGPGMNPMDKLVQETMRTYGFTTEDQALSYLSEVYGNYEEATGESPSLNYMLAQAMAATPTPPFGVDTALRPGADMDPEGPNKYTTDEALFLDEIGDKLLQLGFGPEAVEDAKNHLQIFILSDEEYSKMYLMSEAISAANMSVEQKVV